jgi:hypothetical protein
VLSAFLRPYLERAGAGGPQWLAYARLVAMVSADTRWHRISERCFDPTAGVFIAEIARLFPHADRSTIAVSFIFSVSAMLSLSTSTWRIEALSAAPGDQPAMDRLADQLVRFCEAGMRAALEAGSSFPTPPRRSRRKAKSSPSAPAHATKPARFSRSM